MNNANNKKVGIITMNLHYNIGTALQAYALQQVVKSFGYDCDIITWKRLDIVPFVYNYINVRFLDSYRDFDKIKEDDYDIFIIGSDQVWNRYCIIDDYHDKALDFPFLKFTAHWNKVRFSYSSSLGKGGSFWEYSKEEDKIISNILKQFNSLSLREEQSIKDFNKHLNLSAELHLDPTLLLSKEHYLELCKDIPIKQSGIFKYILNSNESYERNILEISNNLNIPIMTHKKYSVKDWLACYRDAKLIITNSYHGSLFAIIFNKPFIYYNGRDGGNMRFDTLESLFNITYRKIGSTLNFQESLKEPNIDLTALKEKALNYISTNLKAEPKTFNITTNDDLVIDNKPSRKAWLCFISSDNYVYYALNLYKCLLDVKSRYPLYCGVTKDVSEPIIEAIEKTGMHVLRLDTSDIESTGIIARARCTGMCQKYINALAKLDLLKYDDLFDKIIYLDVDMHIFENIDELFHKPHLSAVEDVAPARYNIHKKYKVGDSIFCSGLFVWDMERNKGLAKKIISELDLLPNVGSWHDQNILNYYYQDWKDKLELHLDPTYGLMASSEIFRLNLQLKPKVMHYIQNGKQYIPFTNYHIMPNTISPLTTIYTKKFYTYVKESIDYFNTYYNLNLEPVHLEHVIDPHTLTQQQWVAILEDSKRLKQAQARKAATPQPTKQIVEKTVEKVVYKDRIVEKPVEVVKVVENRELEDKLWIKNQELTKKLDEINKKLKEAQARLYAEKINKKPSANWSFESLEDDDD